VLNGSNSVGIVGAAANTIYSLIAQPQIKSFDDLRGQLVGLSLPIDTISIASRMLCRSTGCRRAPTAARSWWARRCAPIA
jgi:hypothetical protein